MYLLHCIEIYSIKLGAADEKISLPFFFTSETVETQKDDAKEIASKKIAHFLLSSLYCFSNLIGLYS